MKKKLVHKEFSCKREKNGGSFSRLLEANNKTENKAETGTQSLKPSSK